MRAKPESTMTSHTNTMTSHTNTNTHTMTYIHVTNTHISWAGLSMVALLQFLVCNQSLGTRKTMTATHADWIRQWN